MLKDLIKKNRSYRRFYQNEPVSLDTLKELVDLARLSPCEANFQELKFILCNDRKKNEDIFKCLKWAGYLKEWGGPQEGERPAAYIVILQDTAIAAKATVNHGIASQSIALGAAEKGLGVCILQSIDKDAMRALFSIAPQFEIKFVIALGTPKETVIIDDIGVDENIKYYRDKDGNHHVPKRKLNDIIVAVYGADAR